MINRPQSYGRTDNPAGRNIGGNEPTKARFQETRSNALLDLVMQILNTFAGIFCPLKDPKKKK
jgi:hypothetical protein